MPGKSNFKCLIATRCNLSLRHKKYLGFRIEAHNVPQSRKEKKV